MEEIRTIAEEIFETVKMIRRTLHQHPELEFHEVKTAELICTYLDTLGIPYQKNVAKTGIVGLIEVKGAKKTLLVRADMDALPVQEETDLPFKSQVEGVSHACGHDAHVAILLGTAMILMRLKDRLPCNVKLVFQPAEEDAGGALPMIDEGVLENPHVDAAVGGHVMNHVPVGKIMVKDGELMAAPDDFDLVVCGKGGHGAYPQDCIDPIAITTQILSAWNALSARYTTPLEKHLISVNMVRAGNYYNVIPDKAYVKGTVRTFNETVRHELAEKMEVIARQIAGAFGATCAYTHTFRYPPLINDSVMAEHFRKSAGSILGEDNVITGTVPSMGGEDFAYFAQRVPSVFINYGTGNEEQGATMPLHSSDFLLDENGMKTGMIVMSQFAMDFGKE